jgi:hypothetical protein
LERKVEGIVEKVSSFGWVYVKCLKERGLMFDESRRDEIEKLSLRQTHVSSIAELLSKTIQNEFCKI